MFQWTEPESFHRFSTIPGMDPRADYLLGPGFAAFQPAGPDAPIPFLLTIESNEALQFVVDLQRPPAPAAAAGQRSDHYARFQAAQQPRIGDTVSIVAPNRAFFDELVKPDGEFRVFRAAGKQIWLSLPLDPRFFLQRQEQIHLVTPIPNPNVGPPPGRRWPPDTVIVGIIDDGIAIGNARFRTSDRRSRVACFWQQDGLPKTAFVTIGAELLKNDIDTILASCTTGTAIDEDAFYRLTGQADFARDGHKSVALRLAHGTHVLDLAAGASPTDPESQAPTNRPIIAVQLPVAATAGQTGAGLDYYIRAAIAYIQDRAVALAGGGDPLPVVINISYGVLAGPHDGTSCIELAMDTAIAKGTPKTRIVVASGNSNLGRGHEQICFGPHGPDTVDLRWRVQPDGTEPSMLQIWMPFQQASPPAASRLSVEIRPPDFVASPAFGEVVGTGPTLLQNGLPVCQATYSFQSPTTQRGLFTIWVGPTVSQDAATPSASSGVWTIRLTNHHLLPHQHVHAWIERNGQVYGYPLRGRQSYFDERSYIRFDDEGVEVDDDPEPPQPPVSNVRRAGMINAIATGTAPAVIGGYRRRDQEMAAYSAGGPILPLLGAAPDPRPKPDAIAVSDDSLVHYGVLATGSRSGSAVPMQGTSVSAPQVTRWVANQLAGGRSGTRDDVETAAALSPPSLPVVRRGAGRISLPGTTAGPKTRIWKP